jgi:hypothetical protein
MEVELQNKYLKQAESLGIDTGNPRQVEDLLACIRYCNIRFADRRLRDVDIADQIGLSIDQLLRLKATNTIKIATQIVLAEFMDDDARNDVRYRIFKSLQENMPLALANIAKIATGEPRLSDNGKMVRPHFRDQVAAFAVLSNNPMANAWLTNTFLGESTGSEEQTHLQMRDKLMQQKHVNLDTLDVIEGQVKPVSVKNADSQ